MKLGLMVGYSGADMKLNLELVQEAERLGYDSVWTAESWGSDAVAPRAWIGAHTRTIKLGTAVMQLPGRSPANTAMTAMTLDALSGGRHILGLGTSGPQVVEGWHGKAWDRPLTWMREYVSIVRKVFAREEPLTFDGYHYQIPYRGIGSKGLGKPLKSMLHGRRDIPIFAGSMAPKGQALAAEICDGLLLTCMNPERPEVIRPALVEGFAQRTDGRRRENFEIASVVAVRMGDDLAACRAPFRAQLALYLGGMGSRDQNFYNNYLSRAGFEEAAHCVQTLWLDGKRAEALAAVPDEMIDALNLVGSPERIRERFSVWKEADVDTLLVGADQPEAVRLLAELNG
jgi:F420-dependent oxidoreductase-like protein